MSKTSDIANYLLSQTTDGNAVKSLFAVAKVGRPSTWEPAKTMRAELPLAEAVAFAKRGVGFATMVATAPDPTGEVGAKLVKFPQKSVWRTLSTNPDCSEDTVSGLLSKLDQETTSNVLENTDPRYWVPWLYENNFDYLFNIGRNTGIQLNDGRVYAGLTMKRFLPRWSPEEFAEFINIVSATPLLESFVHSIIRCASRGHGPLTLDQAIDLVPEHLTAQERGWIVLAGLTDEATLTAKAISAISVLREGMPSHSSANLPGPLATESQLLSMLDSESTALHGVASQSVVAHWGHYSQETVNTVLSHDNVVQSRSAAAVLARSYRDSKPEWDGYDLLYPSTIDRLVQNNDSVRSSFYTVQMWPTGDELAAETRRVLLRKLRPADSGYWLCGEHDKFRPDADLYIEVLRAWASRKVNNSPGHEDAYVRTHMGPQILRSLHTNSRFDDDGQLVTEISDEVLKMVDYLGSESLEYAATSRTYGEERQGIVSSAVIQILESEQLPTDSWAVVASLAPSWSGTLRELAKTASLLG